MQTAQTISYAGRYNQERSRKQVIELHQEIKRRVAPKPAPVSGELTHDESLVILADRLLTKDGDLKKHQLAIRRARRQHTDLHQAIIRGDLAAVVSLTNEDNYDLATVNGLTPLHLAVAGLGLAQQRTKFRAQSKLVEEQIVDFLIHAGAPVDVWDSMTRLPAACIDGGTLPKSLVQAMDMLRACTAYKPEYNGVNLEKENRTEFNAFFAPDDHGGDSVTGRGGPGNKTGRGGNPVGITRIAGKRFNPAEDVLSRGE